MGLLEPSMKSVTKGPRPVAYVCALRACTMPIKDSAQLRKTVRGLKKHLE